jgi:uncharacterized protein (DUF2267 family)
MAELAFIKKVADWTGLPEDTAERLTEGTLRTLAQRISGGEAEDLAERMPEPLRPFLAKVREPADKFSYEEFMRRVADFAGVEVHTAERGVAAVLAAMRDTAGVKEFNDAMSQLPKEFHALMAREVGARG